MKDKIKVFLAGLTIMLLTPNAAYAMHIMEGFLPMNWAIVWFIVSLPFIIIGFKSVKYIFEGDTNKKLLLGLAGGFVFVLSALKIPSVTGSCSHPTGVALGTVLFGPTAMTVVGFIVLLFQALLLGHGGITTLGANVFSMAIAGPFVSYGIYRLLKNKRINTAFVVFLAAFFGDLITYVVTAVQLSLAFPDSLMGFAGSLGKFLSVFAVTQIPLAVVEGIVTVIVYNLLVQYQREGVIQIENVN